MQTLHKWGWSALRALCVQLHGNPLRKWDLAGYLASALASTDVSSEDMTLGLRTVVELYCQDADVGKGAALLRRARLPSTYSDYDTLALCMARMCRAWHLARSTHGRQLLVDTLEHLAVEGDEWPAWSGSACRTFSLLSAEEVEALRAKVMHVAASSSPLHIPRLCALLRLHN